MTRTLADSAVALAGAALFSAAAHAHPGHDHSHWTSAIIHIQPYATALIALALAVLFAARSARKPRSTKRGERR